MFANVTTFTISTSDSELKSSSLNKRLPILINLDHIAFIETGFHSFTTIQMRPWSMEPNLLDIINSVSGNDYNTSGGVMQVTEDINYYKNNTQFNSLIYAKCFGNEKDVECLINIDIIQSISITKDNENETALQLENNSIIIVLESLESFSIRLKAKLMQNQLRQLENEIATLDFKK